MLYVSSANFDSTKPGFVTEGEGFPMAGVPTLISYDSLVKSGLPAEQKSAIRRWYESQIASGDNRAALAKLHVRAAGETFRATGESLVMGSVLGAVHAISPTGLDIKGIPVDGVGMVLMGIAGIAAAQEEGAKDIANCGAACAAILAFRKTHDLFATMAKRNNPSSSVTKIAKGPGASFSGEENPHGGETKGFKFGLGWNKAKSKTASEDPIVKFANSL